MGQVFRRDGSHRHGKGGLCPLGGWLVTAVAQISLEVLAGLPSGSHFPFPTLCVRLNEQLWSVHKFYTYFISWKRSSPTSFLPTESIEKTARQFLFQSRRLSGALVPETDQ